MKVFRQLGSGIRFAVVLWKAAADFRRLSRSHSPDLHERAEWLHRWSPQALRALKIEVEHTGTPPPDGLLVLNHLSYIDVLVVSSVVPCAFVSKDEVERWPLVGWYCKIAGTIFIDRTNRNDTHRVTRALNDRFAIDQLVVLFPEGTSTDGSKVLRFHPSLFEAPISSDQTVTAAHLHYEETQGDPTQDICFWGDMVFFPHLLRLLGIRGAKAHLSFGSSAHYTGRKTAAIETHAQVLELKDQFPSTVAQSL